MNTLSISGFLAVFGIFGIFLLLLLGVLCAALYLIFRLLRRAPK